MSDDYSNCNNNNNNVRRNQKKKKTEKNIAYEKSKAPKQNENKTESLL